MTERLAVKVHRANVRGAAKNWSYHKASVFDIYETADGRLVWQNTGRSTWPRRSKRLAEADGRQLAEDTGAEFIEGYGSLHHQPIKTEEATSNV
jgi:hypothetical protein